MHGVEGEQQLQEESILDITLENELPEESILDMELSTTTSISHL